jgi:hypothetical protein
MRERQMKHQPRIRWEGQSDDENNELTNIATWLDGDIKSKSEITNRCREEETPEKLELTSLVAPKL